MDSDLVIALRSRVVTVFTPLEFALTENPDEAQLASRLSGGVSSTATTYPISVVCTRNG